MQQIKILMIDDSLEDRHAYKRILKTDKECSYRVFEAEMGEDGLEILLTESVDCVLLDFNLPDMDGIEFIENILKDVHLKQLPIVLLTGQGSEILAVKALKSGATDYLVKGPLTANFLSRTIRNAIEKKNNEIKLLEHNAFINTLIDAIPNPIFYKNIKGEYLGCNRAFEKLMMLNRVDVIGKTASDLFAPEQAKAVDEILKKLLRFPEPFKTEITWTSPDGNLRDVVLYYAPYLNLENEINGFVGSVIDITDHKHMERNLQKSVENLKLANKQIMEQQKVLIEEERLKVLLQMAGATAHELNQPLMALLGFVELLQIEKDNPEKRANYLERIREATYRISEIIKKIQSIRHDETKPYIGSETILDINQKINVLVIEDNEGDFENIESELSYLKEVSLSRAMDIKDGLERLEKDKFDLVFLDYMLPSGTGVDFIRQMKDKDFNIPVVVITGQGDEMVASQVIMAGAYDYLPKFKLSSKSLSRVITNTLEKFRLKREVNQAIKKMAEMSTRDELTGLFNRRYFTEVMEREVDRSRRYGNDLVLCMMDLDHFKHINYKHGHPAGDAVLKDVAQTIRNTIRKSDIACRYGGEKFSVILPNTKLNEARNWCERLREIIADNVMTYGAIQLKITISIGVAQYLDPVDQDVDDLIDKTDRALHKAKEIGRNVVFSAID